MSSFFVYKVATEFTTYPGGRKKSSGDFSGEFFFETVTEPLLAKYDLIHFDLSGSAGLSTGFLDEAFGEIGKKIGLQEAERRIKITCDDDPDAVRDTWTRIKEASRSYSK